MVFHCNVFIMFHCFYFSEFGVTLLLYGSSECCISFSGFLISLFFSPSWHFNKELEFDAMTEF